MFIEVTAASNGKKQSINTDMIKLFHENVTGPGTIIKFTSSFKVSESYIIVKESYQDIINILYRKEKI